MADDQDGRSFEELLAALEAVTERLATGELGIETATDLFEEAERLHALASARLAEVQARVEKLARARPAPEATSPARPAPEATSRARPAPEATSPARPASEATSRARPVG